MSNFTYESLPGRVVFGNGIRNQLGSEIERLGRSQVLILSTAEQESVARGLAKNCECFVRGFFPQAVMHTPVPVSERAVEMARQLKADCTVAIAARIRKATE